MVHITWLDEQGQQVFKRPMWPAVFGELRQELSLPQIQRAYAQRFDLEHFNRFGKQRLLMTAFQTPDVRREESWWQIVQLAYVQLRLVQLGISSFPFSGGLPNCIKYGSTRKSRGISSKYASEVC
ncbi:MAG: hypothetical protein JXB30_18880 [Anaerolineae bacterium]|nr:hypothetical protein [Anaerolineae bacterium]